MKKGLPPSLFSPETDGKLVGKPSNNIPKIILMIEDPVKNTPSSFSRNQRLEQKMPISVN